MSPPDRFAPGEAAGAAGRQGASPAQRCDTAGMTSFPVRPEDVAAARELLRGIISETPMLHSRVLSERLGGPVYLKCENLQRTGSFKARGGYVRMARLPEADRVRGVVAASAGNHAQGVAFAAVAVRRQGHGVHARGSAAAEDRGHQGLRRGCHPDGASVEDAMAAAIAQAQERGSVYIHPFDHPDVIAGQGTVGLEILEQCPDVRTIVIPVGGGGLASGIAIAAKGHDPGIRIVGVQAAAAAPLPPSIAAGHPVRIEVSPTMADGICVNHVGELTFPILSELAERILTVSEDGLSRALLLCLERAKQLVEPAGAAGGGGDCSSTRMPSSRRWSPCCPAGTSTRCCWPRCCGTGSARPAGT